MKQDLYAPEERPEPSMDEWLEFECPHCIADFDIEPVPPKFSKYPASCCGRVIVLDDSNSQKLRRVDGEDGPTVIRVDWA